MSAPAFPPFAGLLLLAVFLAFSAGPGLAEDSGADKELGILSGEVAARVAELANDKTPLPDNVGTLYDMMREIDNDLADYKQRTERLLREAGNSIDVPEIRRRAVEIIGSLVALDCQATPAETVQNYAASLREVLGKVAHVAIEQKLGNGSIRQGGGAIAVKMGCEALKAYVADGSRQDAMLEAFDKVEEEQAADARRREQYIGQVAKLVRILQERRLAIQAAISAKGAQQQLSGGLWKVIAVISLFSISTILAVKLFDLRLQLEWVATGQVIQFVTVMILLSVLMALGLSGVLEQNVLGTLLGSVAGHVLAQGVGRAAAARAVGKAGEALVPGREDR